MPTIDSTARAALALLLLASGCASPSSRTESLYKALQSDVLEAKSGKITKAELRQRNRDRAKEVRAMSEREELATPEERFQAAVLLVETNEPADLDLGEHLALMASAEGEKLAPRVAAEAIDKQLVLRRLPQLYGTQYEWVAALGRWRLYPVDPKTTDSERRLVGVPPLATLYEDEKKLNAARKGP